jgi:phosphate transport system substrate-binding protein
MIFAIRALFLLFSLNLTQAPVIPQEKIKGSITLSGAFALYPMAVRWSEEFRKVYPEVKIDLSAGGAGKGITDALNNMVDIGMVSREVYPEEVRKGAYTIAVAKDAVVPMINASNPALDAILSKGLKKETAGNIWITGMYKTWSQAFGVKGTIPMHIYTRSDACGAAEVWANFFDKKQEDLLGNGVYGDPGLALAVKKDPLGIGYNNIGYIYDARTKKQLAGIRVLPIDINGDGKIGPDEEFYKSIDDLIEAIASGKYPSPPARELYFVTNGKPKEAIVLKFIQWILTDGQKYVNESGFITLSKEKTVTELKKVR